MNKIIVCSILAFYFLFTLIAHDSKLPVNSSVNTKAENQFDTIVDEKGKEFEVKRLDTIQKKDKTFVVFMEKKEVLKSNGTQEVFILEAKTDSNGDIIYESINDDNELDRLFEEFQKNN